MWAGDGRWGAVGSQLRAKTHFELGSQDGMDHATLCQPLESSLSCANSSHESVMDVPLRAFDDPLFCIKARAADGCRVLSQVLQQA